MQVTRLQVSLIIKITLVWTLLCASIVAFAIKVQAKPLHQEFIIPEGPSQSFLVDWGEEVTYRIESTTEEGTAEKVYVIAYASGVLEDGSVIYALRDDAFVLIKDGMLFTGRWGTYPPQVRNCYKDFNFVSKRPL